jgi:hypothetical protein
VRFPLVHLFKSLCFANICRLSFALTGQSLPKGTLRKKAILKEKIRGFAVSWISGTNWPVNFVKTPIALKQLTSHNSMPETFES